MILNLRKLDANEKDIARQYGYPIDEQVYLLNMLGDEDVLSVFTVDVNGVLCAQRPLVALDFQNIVNYCNM